MDTEFFRVVGAFVLIFVILRYRIVLGIGAIALGLYMLVTRDGDRFWGFILLLFGVYVTRFFYIEGKK